MPLAYVGIVSIQVRDLDAAIAFYTDKLGLEKRHDEPMGPGARWVEVAPRGAETRLALICKGNPAFEEDRIGKSIATTFEVTDFEATCAALKERGVRFRVEPRKEPFGFWAEVLDQDDNVIGLHADG